MDFIARLIKDNEMLIIVVSSFITFFLGRYTSHLEDRRNGMKDINETFYKPFLSLYANEHHAYALFFSDLSIDVQKKIVALLLDNCNRVSPYVKEKILTLDTCYSGYVEDIKAGKELLLGEKEYIEKYFNQINDYIEKQYQKNERKLYCSIFKRFLYAIQEIIIKCCSCK